MKMKNKNFRRIIEFPLNFMLHMQRRFGSVTGLVLWFGILWVVLLIVFIISIKLLQKI